MPSKYLGQTLFVQHGDDIADGLVVAAVELIVTFNDDGDGVIMDDDDDDDDDDDGDDE